MAPLRDILSDQDKQKMGGVKHSSPNAKNSNNKHYVQPTQNDLVFVERRRISCPSETNTLPMVSLKELLPDEANQKPGGAKRKQNTPKPVEPNYVKDFLQNDTVFGAKEKTLRIPKPAKDTKPIKKKKEKTNPLLKDFEFFVETLPILKPSTIDPKMLYRFCLSSPDFIETLINLRYVPIYETMLSDTRFDDIVDQYCYEIYINLLPEYHKLRNNLTDKYIWKIYAKAYNQCKTSIVESLESKKPAHLYFKLIENNQSKLASHLLYKYYREIFNEAKNNSNKNFLITVLENTRDIYRSTETTNITLEFIKNNIFSIFAKMIDYALPIAEKLVKDMRSYLYAQIIWHGYDKYSESFFQFDSHRFLQLEISEPIVQPFSIQQQKTEKTPAPANVSIVAKPNSHTHLPNDKLTERERIATILTQPETNPGIVKKIKEERTNSTENHG